MAMPPDAADTLLELFIRSLQPHQRTRFFDLIDQHPTWLSAIQEQLQLKAELLQAPDTATAQALYQRIIEQEQASLGEILTARHEV